MSSLMSLGGFDITVQGAIGLVAAFALLRHVWSWVSQPKHKLPPGPWPKPLIGNLLDFPTHGSPQEPHWSEHKRLYGPISSMNVLGQPIIIINDPKVAKELLDKRSVNYSHRPKLPFAGEMLGFASTMLFIQPDDRFRKQRKVAHNQIGSLSSLQRWNADIDIETRRYLYRQLERPDRWLQNLRQEAGSIILKIVYGYNAEPHTNDTLVDMMEEVMDILSQALVPGAWIVDLIPALQYLPDWIPGTGFQKVAKRWGAIVRASADRPFNFTKLQMLNGEAPISVTSESLRKLADGENASEEELIKWAAISMFAGGSDTSVAQMEMFYLAMIKYPEVQRKAQAELDSVIGKLRLPEPSDRRNLPYVEALLKECFRWQTIGEVAPPHRSVEDDIYEGYLIPKNSMLLVNIAGMFHDEEIYKNPYDFNPQRHLGDNPELDPSELIWGFGRRICPGRWLAASNLWLEIARTLSCFDIQAVKDDEPAMEFSYGLVRRPLPFKIDLRVRSLEQENLIRAVAIDHPFPAEGDGKLL